MTDLQKFLSPATYIRQHEIFPSLLKHNGLLWCLLCIERGQWKLLEHFLEGFIQKDSSETEKNMHQFLSSILEIYQLESPQLKEMCLQKLNENPQDYETLCLLEACILKELKKNFPANPLQPALVENVVILSNVQQKVFSLLKDTLARSQSDIMGVYDENLNLFEAGEGFNQSSLIDHIQNLYPLKFKEFFEPFSFQKPIELQIHWQDFALNLVSGIFGNAFYFQKKNQNLGWNRSLIYWAHHIPENQTPLHPISNLKSLYPLENSHQKIPSIADGNSIEDWLETLNYDKSVVGAYIVTPEDLCLYAGPQKASGLKNWAIHFASKFDRQSLENSSTVPYTLSGQTSFLETFFVHIQVISHCKLVVICEASGILFIINQLRLVAQKINAYLGHFSSKSSPDLLEELWNQDSNLLGYAEITPRGVLKHSQLREPLTELSLRELSSWVASRFRGLKEISPEENLQDIFVHFEKGVVGISPIRDNYFIFVGNEYVSLDWLRFKMSIFLKLL